MVVRGAPAIAIAAALALAVEVERLKPVSGNGLAAVNFLKNRLDYLVSSRPTAVNLADAATTLLKLSQKAADEGADAAAVYETYLEGAEKMLDADVASNKAIGAFGADALLQGSTASGNGMRVLTHCNTGSLATSAYGTALGVIRALHAQGKLETAICTETRPYNQGSRLTAFELVHDKIPAVLVADSAAASMKSLGRVDAVVVGADRIAANGDTANKIGTYSLAISAFHHGVPFYVAAPLTSIDTAIKSGEEIIIEQRSPKELTHAHGGQGTQIAANGVGVWNPAFDVTPARLITGIITDQGVITKAANSDVFDIPAFIAESKEGCPPSTKDSNGMAAPRSPQAGSAAKDGDIHASFKPLDETLVAGYVESQPGLVTILGGTSADWNVKEVGDGNLNFVYILTGPKGSFVLKQALPYVRCVGESWPMTLERAYFETTVLREHGRLASHLVPVVYHFDHPMALTVMEYLAPPHIILRKGLIAGTVYPLLAQHMAEFMASTLFHTSLLALSTMKHRKEVAHFCGNIEMCRLTEQVIFTEPYMDAANNRWSSPHLDTDVQALREDSAIKLEIAGLKSKFCERTQALLHGDLHSGSIMVTQNSTKIIDPEFGFYGPMGFDLGAFLGNLILAYISQDGHATSQDDREGYKLWLLKTIGDTWQLFSEKFLVHWDQNWGSGDAYKKEVYNTKDLQLLVQKSFMSELFQDTLGYAAAKMIRRIVGIAHVEDMESISDVEKKVTCERRALTFAKHLLKERSKYSDIRQVCNALQGSR
ncbi:hypothetical protein M758_6G057800 [Ceratodon purpureus]|nr:hypothetical protein KC19_6G061600 [Ceratodon purpureus]KAG0612862.1 hypothetical protein M758_6G057800 [Ceratodon purpureus]